MYANLKVTIHHDSRTRVREELHVWKLDIELDGTVVLMLDANEGESSYCVEAGERRLAPGTRITVDPDF
jgi:hypothetical protein